MVKTSYSNASGNDHGNLSKPNKYYFSSVKYTYNKKVKNICSYQKKSKGNNLMLQTSKYDKGKKVRSLWRCF